MFHFEYFKPETMEEALTLLQQHGQQTSILAGGTDLVIHMAEGDQRPKYVIDISRLSNLDYIYNGEKQLKIGSRTTIRALEKVFKDLTGSYGLLGTAAGQLGSSAVRNMATIGGNICNALPSAETVPPLLALDAKLIIHNSSGKRTVSIDKFFTGPRETILKKGDLLTEIQVPTPSSLTRGFYIKHSLRGSIDLATVGVAVVMSVEPGEKVCKDIKIALGAVAPTPIRAYRAEKMLIGQLISDSTVNCAAKAASEDAQPRRMPEYKREMITVLTVKAINETMRIIKLTLPDLYSFTLSKPFHERRSL